VSNKRWALGACSPLAGADFLEPRRWFTRIGGLDMMAQHRTLGPGAGPILDVGTSTHLPWPSSWDWSASTCLFSCFFWSPPNPGRESRKALGLPSRIPVTDVPSSWLALPPSFTHPSICSFSRCVLYLPPLLPSHSSFPWESHNVALSKNSLSLIHHQHACRYPIV